MSNTITKVLNIIPTKCIDDTTTQSESNYKMEIVWRNVFGMAIIHLAAAYGAYILVIKELSLALFTYLYVMNLLVAFSIIVGSHRLWSHRSYKAKFGLRLVLAILQTMTMQNDIYEWTRDHRVHHKFAETDADPHNSKRGFFFSHMGWLLCKKHPDVLQKGKTVDMSDLWSDPIIKFQQRFYIPLVILFRFVIAMGIPCYIYDASIFHGLCINSLSYVVTLHHTWSINSIAHAFGYQSYDKNVGARDYLLMLYITMGEGYHNYHHAFPYDYCGSQFGWKKVYNPSTAFIDFCAYMGWAYDLKRPSPKLVEQRVERTGDMAIVMENLPKTNWWVEWSFGLIFMGWPLIALVIGKIVFFNVLVNMAFFRFYFQSFMP